eukprot:jgi/Chlat1/3451/Chrsp23S03766
MAAPTAAAAPVGSAGEMEDGHDEFMGYKAHEVFADVLTDKPGWFSPARLLALFCVINLINYVDRGVIASNGVNGAPAVCVSGECDSGSGIQGAFRLSNFEDGVLPAAFMVGLLVASPTFADLSKRYNPFRLIGAGLAVWTVSTAGCGFAPNFIMLVLCRMFVGVGEASFMALASPFIDDYAPPAQKGRWLSLFYMCIPAGVALGYVFGGLISSVLSWRFAFWVESLLMVPFAVFGFTAAPLTLRMGDAAGEGCAQRVDSDASTAKGSRHSKVAGQVKSFLVDTRTLVRNKIYFFTTLGNVAYTCTLGAYAYWGPKAGKAVFNMDNADTVFGVVTILTGIFGTVAGGALLDKLGASIPRALLQCAVCALGGALFILLAFSFSSSAAFILCFAIGEFLMFSTQGPVALTVLWCVPTQLRSAAMALMTVAVHIFGDVPSPPLLGLLQDHLHNWRIVMCIVTTVLLLASAAWGIGWRVSRTHSSAHGSQDNSTEHPSSQQHEPLLGSGG